MRAWWCIVVMGCSAAEPVELLDNAAWAGLEEGPLAGEACSGLAMELEGAALEVETEGCSPVALVQVLPEAVEAGDTLEVVWWHDWLFAEEPAEGTFTLYLDGVEIYARTEDIPGAPAVYTESFESPAGGTELTLRIANHGANTWNLLRLTRL